jgi:hypothetical protein
MRTQQLVISHAAFLAIDADDFEELKMSSLVMQEDTDWEESEYAEESLAGNVVAFLKETSDE